MSNEKTLIKLKCIITASSFFLNRQEVSHESSLKLAGINFYYILMATSSIYNSVIYL